MKIKKVLFVALLASSVSLIYSCKGGKEVANNVAETKNEEIKPEKVAVTNESVDISDIEDGKTYQTIRYSVVKCDNNELIQASLNTLNEKIKKEAENFKSENKNSVREFVKENPNMAEAQYSYTSDIGFIRQDEKYLSFIEFVYTNTMGAHGMYYQNGYTYDVKSGKKLELTDFVKDKEELRTFLKNWLKEHSDEYGFFDEAESTIDGYINGEYELQFYINKDLIVMFQPYDVAPYAAGLIEVVVDKNLLKVDLGDI